MKNLIVIEDNEKYQYEDIESLVKNIINKDYFNMSKQEKELELEKKAFANTFKSDIQLVKVNEETKEIAKNAFVINDEITFILSLAKFNRIILLERTDSNIFGKYINKENIEENYIIINKFANDIMDSYLLNN